MKIIQIDIIIKIKEEISTIQKYTKRGESLISSVRQKSDIQVMVCIGTIIPVCVGLTGSISQGESLSSSPVSHKHLILRKLLSDKVGSIGAV